MSFHNALGAPSRLRRFVKSPESVSSLETIGQKFNQITCAMCDLHFTLIQSMRTCSPIYIQHTHTHTRRRANAIANWILRTRKNTRARAHTKSIHSHDETHPTHQVASHFTSSARESASRLSRTRCRHTHTYTHIHPPTTTTVSACLSACEQVAVWRPRDANIWCTFIVYIRCAHKTRARA